MWYYMGFEGRKILLTNATLIARLILNQIIFIQNKNQYVTLFWSSVNGKMCARDKKLGSSFFSIKAQKRYEM